MKKHNVKSTYRLILGLSLVIGLVACKNESNAKLSLKVNEKDTAKSTATLSELRIPANRVNVGNVLPDKTISGSYSIVNTGANNLFIEYVNPDCTCTGYTLSKKEIPPGDSAKLVLNMSTKDKEGEVAVHATISANTMTRLYQVSLIANVLSDK